MVLTVKWFNESNERELQRWLNDYNEVQNGTYKYDGSIPKSYTDSLINTKIKTCIIVKTILSWYDEDVVVQTSSGNTALGYSLQQVRNTNDYNKQLQIASQLFNEVNNG